MSNQNSELLSVLTFLGAPSAAKPVNPPTPTKSRSALLLYRLAEAMTKEDCPDQDAVLQSINEILMELLARQNPDNVNVIHALAAKLVELLKARHLQNGHLRSPLMNIKWQKSYDSCRYNRRMLFITRAALLGHQNGVPRCNPVEARELARRVAHLFEVLKNYAAKLPGYHPQKEEGAEHDRIWRVIRYFEAQLTDVPHVSAMLCGDAMPAAGELAALREVLSRYQYSLEKQIRQCMPFERSIQDIFDDYLATVAFSPRAIFAVEKQTRSIERAILQQLRKLESA